MDDLHFLTPKEMAKVLRTSVRQLSEYRRKGIIPAFRITDKMFLYDRDKVIAALEQRQKEAADANRHSEF